LFKGIDNPIAIERNQSPCPTGGMDNSREYVMNHKGILHFQFRPRLQAGLIHYASFPYRHPISTSIDFRIDLD
jgi:hypothetical protein